MNRRTALKNLGLLTGGFILLPSCNFSKEKVTIILNKLQITAKEEALVKEIVATIIPEGEIPGAKSLEVHNFVWVMVDDCLSIEKQTSFMNGLKLFDTKVNDISGNSFSKLPENKRITVLKDLLNANIEKGDHSKKSNIEDIQNFIKTTKYYTGFGYMQSKYIMTKIMPYQLVPGTYGTCDTIETNKRINVNG